MLSDYKNSKSLERRIELFLRCIGVFIFKILYHCRVLHFFQERMSFKKYMRLLRFLNPFRISTPGRIILEEVIMPAYFPAKNEKVLIVGFQRYNLHYPFFYIRHRVTVCDVNPKAKQLVLAGDSFIGRFEEFPVEKHSGSFALIHFNGMYGWGIDKYEEMIRAAEVIFSLLKPGGVFIFGHNIFDHNPLSMEARYKEYFSQFSEVKNKFFPIVRPDINQIFRVFVKSSNK